MVVGFTTTYAISVYNHSSCEFKSWSWCTWGVLDTTLCDKVCQWLATDLWFSTATPVSSTNITDCHDIIESGVKHHSPNPNSIFNLFCFFIFILFCIKSVLYFQYKFSAVFFKSVITSNYPKQINNCYESLPGYLSKSEFKYRLVMSWIYKGKNLPHTKFYDKQKCRSFCYLKKFLILETIAIVLKLFIP